MYKNIYTCTVNAYPVYSFIYSLDLASNGHLVTYASLRMTGLQHSNQLKEDEFPRREGFD